MVANARFAPPWGRSDPATGGRRSRCAGHGRTGSVYDLHLLPTRGIGRRTSAWKTNQHGKGWGCSLPRRARIFVVDKSGASVSAAWPGSRRFATLAQIESKHDVRRKVRDAQTQVNRERLKRETRQPG